LLLGIIFVISNKKMELDLVIKGLKHFKKIVHPKTDFITFQNVSDTEVDIILSSKSTDDPQFKVHAFREQDNFTDDSNGKMNYCDYFEISFLENGEWIDMWASYNDEDPLHEARRQLTELIELSSSEDEEEEEQEENYYDEEEEDDEDMISPKKRRTTE
jgi:hypothetical protein